MYVTYYILDIRNDDIGFGRHITRAIALANVANENKQKSLFAMNLTPFEYMKESELYMTTTNTTECPYRWEHENSAKQYFYDMNCRETTGKKYKRKNNDFQYRNQKVMNVSQSKSVLFILPLRKIIGCNSTYLYHFRGAYFLPQILLFNLFFPHNFVLYVLVTEDDL